MKQFLEQHIRDILVNAQATHDAKIKMISEICDSLIRQSINETMYFVRTHHSPGTYPNIDIQTDVILKLKQKENELRN